MGGVVGVRPHPNPPPEGEGIYWALGWYFRIILGSFGGCAKILWLGVGDWQGGGAWFDGGGALLGVWGCARIGFMDDEVKYWAAFGGIPQLGPARFRRLEGYFGSMRAAWGAGVSDLRAAGLDGRTAQAVAAGREGRDPDAVMAGLARAGVGVTWWGGGDYPARLKQIADAPPVLYYLGQLLPGDECSVAIVGTRRPTAYGREAALALGRDLAAAGVTVVSGLALGIDGAAHRAALGVDGGRTVAVVAGGLDRVYPREHAGLFRQIRGRGAVVSEHPPGVRPDPRNFPRRNRLISGMTLGTVVVEADEGSGARWTVYQALEQNREVFCVPGSIFSPASRFTNRMIKEGAKLVADYSDILEELNLPGAVAGLAGDGASRGGGAVLGGGDAAGAVTDDGDDGVSRGDGVTGEVTDGGGDGVNPGSDGLGELDDGELALVSYLGGKPLHVDDLCRLSGLPIATVTGILTLLEIKGIVEQVGSMHYVKSSAVGVTDGC